MATATTTTPPTQPTIDITDHTKVVGILVPSGGLKARLNISAEIASAMIAITNYGDDNLQAFVVDNAGNGLLSLVVEDTTDSALQLPSGCSLKISNPSPVCVLVDISLNTFADPSNPPTFATIAAPVDDANMVAWLAAQDKLGLADLKTRSKTGDGLSDLETATLYLGDSAKAARAFFDIGAGVVFNDLRTKHALSETAALLLFAIYNMQQDTSKYEAELAINMLESDPSKLQSFFNYLNGAELPLPKITSLLQSIRTNPTIYNALRDWYNQPEKTPTV